MSERNDYSVFLETLLHEIQTKGGHPRMISFSHPDQAQRLCAALADIIVRQQWRVPRSIIEQKMNEFVEDASFLPEGLEREAWRHYNWCHILVDLGIPVMHFQEAWDEVPIPQAILDQIRGKPATYPMIVNWGDGFWKEGEYVVVNLDPREGDLLIKVGEVIPSEMEFRALSVAPATHFDLNA